MKTKLTALVLFALVAMTCAVLGNSHPDSPNNGKDSPRFYASPPAHPYHP